MDVRTENVERSCSNGHTSAILYYRHNFLFSLLTRILAPYSISSLICDSRAPYIPFINTDLVYIFPCFHHVSLYRGGFVILHLIFFSVVGRNLLILMRKWSVK